MTHRGNAERLSAHYSWRHIRGGIDPQLEEISRPTFDGHGDIEEKLEELEEYLQVRAVPESAKIIFLKRMLTGEAKLWYTGIGKYITPAQGISTFEALKNALKQAFPEKKDSVEVESQFYAGRQGGNEKASKFVTRMLNLWADLDIKLSEAQLITHIVKRTRPEVREQLEKTEINDRSNLFNAARDIDTKYSKRGTSQVQRFQQETWRGQRHAAGQYDHYRGNKNWNNYQRPRYNRNDDNYRRPTPPSTQVCTIILKPVSLPHLYIVLHGICVRALFDTSAGKSLISERLYNKYFKYRALQRSNIRISDAQGNICNSIGIIELKVEIRQQKVNWKFEVVKNLSVDCILGTDFMTKYEIDLIFSDSTIKINKETKKITQNSQPATLEINLAESCLNDPQKNQLNHLLNEYSTLFSNKPGLTHVA